MKICVITGASSGLGKSYVNEVFKRYPELEEIWIIARREERLQNIAKEISDKIKPYAMDITDKDFCEKYKKLLSDNNAEIKLLINNAGFGKLGLFEDISIEDNAGMVELNCVAFTNVARISLPYIKEGGKIINICSIASFAPNTGMTVYSSTKAYIMSFSKGLRAELRPKRINVLAVCPGPMDTEFLPVAGIYKGKSKAFDKLPRVNPDVMARKSLIASDKGRGVYTNRLMYKFYRLVAKILPVNLVMRFCGT